jgi:hypothetical protein
LRVLRPAERAVLQVSGVPVKPRCWPCSIRKLAVGTKIKFPVYNSKVDGNVFDWLLRTAEDFRKIKQRERDVELKKASAQSQSVDRSKVEN